jgi:hypothetical protein
MGYQEPDVFGMLLLPPAEKSAKGTALANAYTALRELNHFTQPDTVFAAQYEERDGAVNDPTPPFARCVVVPVPPAPRPGAPEPPRESPAARAALHLAADLLSPLGRAAEEARCQRQEVNPGDVSISAFGQAALVWPRQALLARAARGLGAAVLTRWTASDAEVIGQYVTSWLAQRWEMEKLAAEHLVTRLQLAGEKIVGQPPEAVFTAEAQPFAQRGWFAKEPDPARLWQSVCRLQQMVGMPDERAMQRTVGEIEQKLDEAADAVAREYGPKFSRLATTLLEHPDYRLVGAEEVVKQANALIEDVLRQYEPMAANLAAQAIDAYNLIHGFLHAERGQRRPAAAEVAEAVRTYPTWRYQSLILRQVCRVYSSVRTQLSDQHRELRFCRQRLEEITAAFGRESRDPLPAPERTLLPRGVPSVDAALTALQATITTDDLRSFDKKLQIQIEQEFNALFNVCLSSVNMLGSLQQTIEDQAKAFLAPRLADTSLAQMFASRFPDRRSGEQALQQLHEQAAPSVKLSAPDKAEFVIVGGPSGEDSGDFRELAERALPTSPSNYVAGGDEVFVYREYAHIPLTALPQLGPLAEDAYNAALDGQGGSPHSRCDITSWQDVEVG